MFGTKMVDKNERHVWRRVNFSHESYDFRCILKTCERTRRSCCAVRTCPNLFMTLCNQSCLYENNYVSRKKKSEKFNLVKCTFKVFFCKLKLCQ